MLLVCAPVVRGSEKKNRLRFPPPFRGQIPLKGEYVTAGIFTFTTQCFSPFPFLDEILFSSCIYIHTYLYSAFLFLCHVSAGKSHEQTNSSSNQLNATPTMIDRWYVCMYVCVSRARTNDAIHGACHVIDFNGTGNESILSIYQSHPPPTLIWSRILHNRVMKNKGIWFVM